MNLILLFDGDFVGGDRVRLHGPRLEHVLRVHRASVGDTLRVGRLTPDPSPRVAGRGETREHSIGTGTITRLDTEALEMTVRFEAPAPPKLPLTLVLAVPRPKVLNRVIAGATSMGVARIILVNAWRVEKSYWKSPRMSEENLLHQRLLGLEQACDTVLPQIELRRFFRPFVEHELPETARGTLQLAAHPDADLVCPRAVDGPVTLVIGPEGGFIAEEVASLERAGFLPVSLGGRILRVETAVAALIGRIF